MADKSVAIRLATTGAAQVRNDFAGIGDAGDQQAQRLSRVWLKAGDDIDKATQRQAAAAAKIAALAPPSVSQTIDRSVGSSQAGATSSGATYSALAMQMRQDEAGAEALRAAIDPLYAAQKRFDAEMEVSAGLLARGAISQEEYGAATKLAQSRLDGLSTAHGRVGASGMIADHVIRSFTDSIVAGQSPVRAFAMEVPRMTEALQFMSMGAEGGEGALAKMAAVMSGGWGIAITAGVSALAVLGPELLKTGDDADTMKDHQEALGKIIDQTTGRINEQSKALILNQAALSESDAKQAESMAAKAKAILLGAASPTYVQGSPYGGGSQYIAPDPRISAAITDFNKSGDADKLAESLTRIGQASPKLKTTTDAILAQGAAFVTSTRQVQQYQAQIRLLMGDPKPGDRRTAIGQFGPEKPDIGLVDAQAKLAAATTARERAEATAQITQIKGRKAVDDGTMSLAQYQAAMTKADAAVNAASGHSDRHAASLARDAAAMEAITKNAIDAADAYLKLGAAAGIEADARGKATASATKSGADIEAAIRRQLAQTVAEGNEAGAKAISALRMETAARTQVNDATEQGALRIDQVGQSLSDEQRLRELTIQQSLAYRLGLTGDYDAITATIVAYRQALDEAHRSEADSGSIKALDDIRKRVEDAQLAKRFAGDRTGGYEAARDMLAANRAADANGDNPEQRAKRVSATGDATSAEQDADRAKTIAEMRNGQSDAIELATKELAVVGQSVEQHDQVVARLKIEQVLRNANVDLATAEAQATIDGALAQAKVEAALGRSKAAMDELRQTGDKFIDDLFNPKTFSIKNELKEIEEQLLKMSAINPLKNLLLGESNPTFVSLLGGGGGSSAGGGLLGSIFGKLKGLFGGGGGSTSNAAWDFGSGIGSDVHFAAGTEYSSAGAAWVGENGPELINLPQGSKVTNAADTRRLMTAGDAGGAQHFHFDFKGAVVTQDLIDHMNRVGNEAAQRGAIGGSQMAVKSMATKQRRSLSRS